MTSPKTSRAADTIIIYRERAMKIWALCITLLTVTGSQGACFYVSKAGNNTNGTSWATAWNELNQIQWTAVDPGDTVLIGGGTYTTALTLSKAGTATNRIRVIRATEAGHNGKVTLTGCINITQAQGRTTNVGIYVTQPYTTVDGIDKDRFEFQAPNVHHVYVDVNHPSDYFEIKNALFTNIPDGSCWARSIHVANGSLCMDHCELYRSQCQEDIISWKAGNGSSGRNLKIQNSILRDWVSIGGSHSDMVEGGTSGTPHSDSLIFTHNLVDDGVTGGHNICFMVYDTWNYVDMSYNVFKDVNQVLQGHYNAGRIVNNTYFRTAGEGGSGVNTYANNIFANDSTLTTGDRYNWEKYSLFFHTWYQNQFSSTPDGNGNLGGDPKFLDPESILGADGIPFTADDGFNLQAGSAAIDRGTGLGFTLDIRGTAIAGNPDIGAYEYTTAAVTWDRVVGEEGRMIPGARCASPINAGLLRLALETDQDLRIYKSTGRSVNAGHSLMPGIYLAGRAGQPAVYKIVVIR